MPHYCLNRNAQPTGEHEVHDDTQERSCLPNPENRIDLGSHDSCWGAVLAARQAYPQASIDGCAYCCPECHTR